MKKKIWDKGLYIEGLRRGRTMTIVFAIIALLTVLFTCSSVMSRSRQALDYTSVSVSPNEGILYAWFSIAVFLAAAPFLTLRTFSFLNSRASCDFWHAIPHTRTCLYVSFLSALLTEYVFLLSVTGVSAWLAFLISSRFIRLIPGTLILFLVGSFSACLLITGALLLAMSRTGTLLSNLVVGGMILAVPRTLITCIAMMIRGSLEQVYDLNILPFSDPKYNIPFGFLAGFDTETIRLPSSILYTAILGLIYLSLSLWLFNTRKSENAGASAPSRRLQAVCRIAVGCSVSFIVTVYLVGDLADGYTYYLPYMIFYTVSVILYFLYELLTTKRAKNLINALPGLCVVIALNVLLGFTVQGIYRSEDAFGRDADKIKSVSVLSDDDRRTLTLTEYALERCGKSMITDREAIAIISDALNTETQDNTSKLVANVKVRIRTAFTAKNRLVSLKRSDLSKLTEGLKNTDEFTGHMINLPDAVKYGTRAMICINDDGNYYEHVIDLDDDKYDVIRSLLKEDIESLGPEKWLEMNFSTAGERDEKHGYLWLEIDNTEALKNGGRLNISVRIPLNSTDTPKTFEKLNEYAAEDTFDTYEYPVPEY